MNYKELSNMLFPNIAKTPDYYQDIYRKRKLPKGAVVTRFAPSPTGFIHIGGLFTSLVSSKMSKQSDGVLFLRIEDTDKKREIEGGVKEIIEALANFGIEFDEGVLPDLTEKGAYGPYKQSDRMEIYQTFAKHLVEQGKAYPCFCSEEELEESRKKQEELKIRTGYYGEWAKYREISLEQVSEILKQNKKFVLRLKSPGKHEEKKEIIDLIKGKLDMSENDQDIVLIKSDGLPTYHFAHLIDDHLMGTTHVIRGDEWLSSLPLHIQLFDIMGWNPPHFAHISPILKMEGSSKRKLSKRKDPEAAVRYYHEMGYPNEAVIEYLLTLANSAFEEWRIQNPDMSNNEYELKIENMSVSGALFDIIKLTDISKDIIAKMTAKEVLKFIQNWAQKYDKEFYELINRDIEYSCRMLNIERNTAKPRKDLTKWSDARYEFCFFFDELFKEEVVFPENVSSEDIDKILKRYSEIINLEDDREMWFEKVRSLSEELGFSKDVKSYKKNPEMFKGHVGDVSQIIRIALTGRKNTPDLYEIIKVLGKERVLSRLSRK